LFNQQFQEQSKKMESVRDQLDDKRDELILGEILPDDITSFLHFIA